MIPVNKPSAPTTTSDNTGVSPAEPPVPTGWACPVCGKGNAPWSAACRHCAANSIWPQYRSPWWESGPWFRWGG